MRFGNLTRRGPTPADTGGALNTRCDLAAALGGVSADGGGMHRLDVVRNVQGFDRAIGLRAADYSVVMPRSIETQKTSTVSSVRLA
jgi:hypothetical protein